jgi:hypothetical protein
MRETVNNNRPQILLGLRLAAKERYFLLMNNANIIEIIGIRDIPRNSIEVTL